MILTCPNCSTRYQADEAKFPPSGRQVRCAKCGHVWHQPGPEVSVAAAAAGSQPHSAPEAQAEEFEPIQRIRAQMAAAVSHTAPPPRPLWPLIGIALGWVVL